MTDQRINLAELRDRAVRKPSLHLDAPTVLALVEAVEAAHALDASPLLDFDNQLWANLSAALKRFDFGDAT